MLKISSKSSVLISIILSSVFLICCIIGAFILPDILQIVFKSPNIMVISKNVSNSGKTLIYILTYTALAVAVLADILLFKLLINVNKSKIFTFKSISLIRGVSWCCFLLCIIFSVLGIYIHISLILAFATAFLGICLRVVKNVIEEATMIKTENDLTV